MIEFRYPRIIRAGKELQDQVQAPGDESIFPPGCFRFVTSSFSFNPGAEDPKIQISQFILYFQRAKRFFSSAQFRGFVVWVDTKIPSSNN